MAVNPDTIPRYAPPTPAELEEMCGDIDEDGIECTDYECDDE